MGAAFHNARRVAVTEMAGPAGSGPVSEGGAAAPSPVSRADALSVRNVLRAASGLSAATVVSIGLAVPASFLVARWLGTEDFGRAQFVVLAYAYAALIRIGVFEGGVRAFIDHHSRGEDDEAVRAQNAGVTYDLAFALLPGVVLAIGSVWLDDPLRRLGFVLAPVAAVTATFSAFLAQLHTARMRFSLVARVNLLRALVHPAVLLGGVLAFGPAAVFLGPVLVDAAVILVYGLSRAPLGLRPLRDWPLAKSLTRVGLPLGLSAVVYWAYRLVGSTSIALLGNVEELGLYVFAAAPITLVLRALTPVQAVATPILWGAMATDDGEQGRRAWVASSLRLTVAMTALAGLATGLLQAGFRPVVLLAVPSFSDGIPIFEVLSLTIVMLTVALIPSLVLDSAKVNKQATHLAIWAIALPVNAAANAAALALGGGPLAVAWNDVWVQVLVVVVIFEVAAPHFMPPAARWKLYGRLTGLAMVTGVAAIALRHVPAPADPTLAGLAPQLLLRVAVVLGIWAAALAGWWAARWLLTDRKPLAAGIDTPAGDQDPSD